MSSIFVWMLMIPQHFLCSFSLTQAFFGEKKDWSPNNTAPARCRASPPRSGCLCVVQWALLHMELLLPSVKALHESPDQIKSLIRVVLWDL